MARISSTALRPSGPSMQRLLALLDRLQHVLELEHVGVMADRLGIGRAAAGLRAAGHLLADRFVVLRFLGEFPDGQVFLADDRAAARRR